MYKPTPHFLIALAAAAALYFGCTAMAGAADVTVSGTNANQDVSGAALPNDGSPNSLRDTRIRYGTCNAAKTSVATVTDQVTIDAGAPGAAFSKVLTGLNLTEYCFQARHSNVGNQFSDWTTAVAKNLTPPLRKPGAPTGISVAALQEDLIVSARWAAEAFSPVELNLGG